jgi:hypothetical protein
MVSLTIYIITEPTKYIMLNIYLIKVQWLERTRLELRP